jgi:modulator of FtsH protease
MSNFQNYQQYSSVPSLEIQNKVLRNTYTLLALSLLPMVAGAIIGTSVPALLALSSGWIGLIIFFIGAYGLMYLVQANRNSSAGIAFLLAFTGFLGIMMGPLLHSILAGQNGGKLIAYAAGGTATVFFGMAAIGSAIKRPLNGMGKVLGVLMLVVFAAAIANIFLKIPMLALIISSCIIVLSSLIMMWQINAVVTGGETNYISATLTLVIQIFNLFTSLLQILGIFGGRDD